MFEARRSVVVLFGVTLSGVASSALAAVTSLILPYVLWAGARCLLQKFHALLDLLLKGRCNNGLVPEDISAIFRVRFVPLVSDTRCFALAHSGSRSPESILTGCLELGKHFWGYL